MQSPLTALATLTLLHLLSMVDSTCQCYSSTAPEHRRKTVRLFCQLDCPQQLCSSREMVTAAPGTANRVALTT